MADAPHRDGIRAVTFDAYRTILTLDRPFERLHAELVAAGLTVSPEAAERAMRLEMEYYRHHHLDGSNAHTIRLFRRHCARVLFDGLAAEGVAFDLSADEQVEILLGCVQFRLYDDVLPAFSLCRRKRLGIGILSNWDYTLPDHLATLGVSALYDTVTVSATVGAAKPDRRIFLAALAGLGVEPAALVHVGDEYETDILGAQALSIRAILLDREGNYPDANCDRITSLAELADMLE